MGSILGGGKSKSSSGAINSAASNVANVAQAGGQTSSNAITNASQTSANSILQGSQTAAAGQQQAQQYLQQADALPSGLREQALRNLGDIYNGNSNISQRISDQTLASPMYQTMVQQGENSVLRNASATGGLRSGNANEALAQVNQNSFANAYQNLYNDHIQGLQGLASLPSNANTIAGYMSGAGSTLGQGQVASAQTLAQGQISASDAVTNANNAAATAMSQGQVAAAQSNAQGSQNSANNMMGLANLGIQAWGMFSDRRLKTNIEFTGEENGIRKYKWTWNNLAARLGLRGKGHGVMADEVEKTHPQAVSMRDGFMFVDYQKLGVSHGL